MKFTDSRLCLSHEYCTTCRQKEAGRDWRTLAARIYEVESVDFVCPYGIDWLAPNQTIDPAQFKVQLKINLPIDDKKLGEQLLTLETVLRERLPETSLIIKALNIYAFEFRHGTGCTGCRKRRLLNQLGQSARNATPEDKAIISELLSA